MRLKALAITALGALTLWAAMPAGARADAASDAIIRERKAGYKHIGEIFGGMKKQGIDVGADVTQFAGGAQEIAAWGRKLVTLFPDGTQTGEDTHALPAIWTDRATFEKYAADLVTNADKLAAIAASGDKAAFADQWKATGGSCGACHRTFRAKLN